MTDRPTFILSKGERNKEQDIGDIIERYRCMNRGIYEWSGLPDDVPYGYIEDCIFDVGCAGAKNVKGIGLIITPAAPVDMTIYGTPKKWLPSGLRGQAENNDIFVESDVPALYFGISTADKIAPYMDIMDKTLKCLRQNIIGMSQPIMLEGAMGGELGGMLMSSELSAGSLYIPYINKSAVGANVLDLKATDRTQSLIATFNAMDTKILSIMGVRNAGTEKASGVTAEETVSITQELDMVISSGLKIREKWCEAVNSKLGTSFSVELGEPLEPEAPPVDTGTDMGTDEEGADYEQ